MIQGWTRLIASFACLLFLLVFGQLGGILPAFADDYGNRVTDSPSPQWHVSLSTITQHYDKMIGESDQLPIDSIIPVGKYLFCEMGITPNYRIMVCVDAHTGKILWHRFPLCSPITPVSDGVVTMLHDASDKTLRLIKFQGNDRERILGIISVPKGVQDFVCDQVIVAQGHYFCAMNDHTNLPTLANALYESVSRSLWLHPLISASTDGCGNLLYASPYLYVLVDDAPGRLVRYDLVTHKRRTIHNTQYLDYISHKFSVQEDDNFNYRIVRSVHGPLLWQAFGSNTDLIQCDQSGVLTYHSDAKHPPALILHDPLSGQPRWHYRLPGLKWLKEDDNSPFSAQSVISLQLLPRDVLIAYRLSHITWIRILDRHTGRLRVSVQVSSTPLERQAPFGDPVSAVAFDGKNLVIGSTEYLRSIRLPSAPGKTVMMRF